MHYKISSSKTIVKSPCIVERVENDTAISSVTTIKNIQESECFSSTQDEKSWQGFALVATTQAHFDSLQAP